MDSIVSIDEHIKTTALHSGFYLINSFNQLYSSIQYNYLNLPGKITQNSKVTDYIYRADGVKVRKVFGTETTDYLDGFQYTDSVLKFFPTTEGYFNVETGKYVYNYTDHLGNTRLSYAKNGAGTEIIEESNYYPFGLKHDGYNALAGNPAYKYKYNGKELQETGMYAMDFRHYMLDIGRFTGMDRFSELAPAINSYRFAFNNPILYSDPTGLFETRKEARAYRKTHGIKDTINKESDGSYAINDRANYVSYNQGAEPSGDSHPGDGVAERALLIGKKGNSNKTYDPSTIGQNIFYLSYLGGNNPKNRFDKRLDDFTYIPMRLSEYPAIGHDRRYDNLKIAGAKGLLTNTRAIGTDYKFVGEELSIALNPFSGAADVDRLQAASVSIGLGIAALPKTLFKYSASNNAYDFIQDVKSDYKKASQGVTNTPTGATRNEMIKDGLKDFNK
ncbi:RHS repeat-associated core domain-containing protein (plasmid) [Chryseobacterium panacisoli]|uniref:RHS repeat-associated core domain-containing protein n=1 Tax=Chryseobacterium panacisoli TaxID=1807141 RepID=A0A5D8ZWY4_9FLAO|nr:RHS repeat-associated core domain-containing protein [Chryseobacterium panacisoli]